MLGQRYPAKRKAGNPMSKIDWSLVNSNSDISDKFTVDVHNRFSELCAEGSEPLENYHLLTQCVEEVAVSTLPKRVKRKVKSLSSLEAINKAREELQAANNRNTDSPSASTKEAVKKARDKLQAAYDTATAEELQEQINNLTALHTSHKHAAVWKSVNEITGRKDKPTVTVQGGSAEKRNEGWLHHFKKLLGEAPSVTPNLPRIQVAKDLNISTENFVMAELLKVVNPLSKKKKMGPDNVPPIIWKDPKFHQLLLDTCNQVLNSSVAPPLWLTSDIIPLPKKGNLTLHQNYRGISLTSIAAKIYNKLL